MATLALKNESHLGVVSIISATLAGAIIVRDLASQHLTSVSLCLIQPLWIYRVLYRNGSWPIDLLFTVSIEWWRHGRPSLIPSSFIEWLKRTQSEHVPIYGIFLAIAIFSAAIVIRGNADTDGPIASSIDKDDEYLLPPLLIPGRTNHTRLFPKKHSFSYSYFYVGVPVGWTGCAGSALSADIDLFPGTMQKRGWFHVSGADYLDRNDDNLTLDGKLRSYLRSEGVKDNAWSFAYLVTAPRFLGYAFNPVSFWYLYDSHSQLTMMVLEVNNTFDERRMYLLKAEGKVDQNGSVNGSANGSANEDVPKELHQVDAEVPMNAVRFSNAWTKDFHVSPFNSRKGFYALTAQDPLQAYRKGNRLIDSTITLKSSKEHPKIIARAFSEGTPLDPSTISTFALSSLLLSWFTVGFLTFPRIIKEAFKLFFIRRLHVWYRPEVLPSSLGRRHTAEEETLSTFFVAYLEHTVQQCPSPLRLTYQPAGGLGTTATWTSPGGSEMSPELKIRVLTPAFYTRFVHYAFTTEAFDRECLSASDKAQTVLIEHPELLPQLFPRRQLSARSSPAQTKLSFTSSARWRVLKSLRCAPPTLLDPSSLTSASKPPPPSADAGAVHKTNMSDIRSLPLSDLDEFVLSSCEVAEVGVYRRLVTKLFLAQRVGMGVPALVGLGDLCTRAFVIWAGIKTVELLDVETAWRNGDVGGLTGAMIAANLVHTWALLKGN